MVLKCNLCEYEIKKNDKFITTTQNNIQLCFCQKCVETIFTSFDPKSFLEITKITQKQLDTFENIKQMETFNLPNLLPNELHEKFNEYIIGQNKAKQKLSVALFQHLNRIKTLNNTQNKSLNQDLILKKANILLIGDSGSGKTLFAETMAKILQVPFIITDATNYTSKGYVGGDVEDMISQLYLKSDKNKQLTERGIVFIDEIDKIASKQQFTTNKDVSGIGVQENLLKMVEGKKVILKQNIIMEDEPVEIDTKHILFIFGGAFSDLKEITSLKQEKKVGFFTNTNVESAMVDNDIIEQIIQYGFSPEFIGRIPNIVLLSKLTSKELKEIIFEPKNAIFKQYFNFFRNFNIDISFEEESIDYIVTNIEHSKIGARILHQLFENIFDTITYNIQHLKNNYLIITKKYIISKDIQDLQLKKKELHNEFTMEMEI